MARCKVWKQLILGIEGLIPKAALLKMDKCVSFNFFLVSHYSSCEVQRIIGVSVLDGCDLLIRILLKLQVSHLIGRTSVLDMIEMNN